MTKIGLWIECALGAIGSAVASMFGGWSDAMTTLMIFMAVDYITGLMCALVFRRSPKTSGGAYDSKVGFRGLCKKGGILLVVLVAARLDIALGVTFVRDAAIIGFVVNETVSIIENLGSIGVPIPAVIKKALELLRDKEDKTGGNDNEDNA